LLAPLNDSSYDASIDRALRTHHVLSTKIEQELQAAPELLANVEALPAERRFLELNRAPYRTLGFFLYLRSRVTELPPQNPAQTLERCTMALQVLQGLDPGAYFLTPQLVADSKAEVLALRGNSSRLLKDFEGGLGDFEASWESFERGVQDSLTKALILNLQANFTYDLGHVEDALPLLDHAYQIVLRFGTLEAQFRLRAKLALTLGLLEPSAAIPLLAKLEEAKLQLDDELCFHVVHNLAWFQVERGQAGVAKRLLERNWSRYSLSTEVLALPYRYWLRGRVDAALGDFEAATRYLQIAYKAFRELEVTTDQLLCTLDLARLLHATGRPAEASRLIDEGEEVLRSERPQADRGGIESWRGVLPNPQVLRALTLWLRLEHRSFADSCRLLKHRSLLTRYREIG
jgi:tetratricopeptide (TPR) repeat protein